MIQQSINQLLTLAGAATSVGLHDAQKQTDIEYQKLENQKERTNELAERLESVGVSAENTRASARLTDAIGKGKETSDNRGNIIGEMKLKKSIRDLNEQMKSGRKTMAMFDLKKAGFATDKKSVYNTINKLEAQRNKTDTAVNNSIEAIRTGVENNERTSQYLEFLKEQRNQPDILAEIRKRKESEK